MSKKDRYTQLRGIAENLRSQDFEKIAQDPGMMAAGAPPMPPMPDPSMLPMAEGAEGGPKEEGTEAAKGMKEVAMKALDMTQGVIAEALKSETLSPADKLDATAAALESSGALEGVPPEELQAAAQMPPAAPPIV